MKLRLWSFNQSKDAYDAFLYVFDYF